MHRHPTWCRAHDEGICTSIEEAGEWDAVLQVADGHPRIWPEHPGIIRVEDEATLSPRASIELGRALILQGMRGLEVERGKSSDFAGSDEESAFAGARCIRGVNS